MSKFRKKCINGKDVEDFFYINIMCIICCISITFWVMAIYMYIYYSIFIRYIKQHEKVHFFNEIYRQTHSLGKGLSGKFSSYKTQTYTLNIKKSSIDNY